MRIELLADNTGVLPTLVDWYERTWSPYYGVGGPGNAQVDLASRCNRDAMPVGFVAKESNQLLGVAALNVDSATIFGERLGHDRVYISTTVLGDHLLRNAWRRIGDTPFLNDEHGSIYVFDLPASE